MLGLALSLNLVWLLPLNAEIGGIEIRWEKKVVDSGPSKSGMHVAGTTEDCVYKIILTNNSFKDAPAMVVKYMVFVERQSTGQKQGAEHIDKLKGTKSVEPIKSHQKAFVETDSFAMKEAKLAPGWYYPNGGKLAARDSIKGVWVRVYQDNKVVAEYVNPSIISKREQWKD